MLNDLVAHVAAGTMGAISASGSAGDLLGPSWESDPRLRTILHRLDLVVAHVVVVIRGLLVLGQVRGRRRA
ncbi:hypothetical protein [Lichenibacterium dinghuense]|uniref:hypothetical protein n=1 Tax=Lichenibacterium dinghuense TaxID=2895977 RepID=UPI001F30776B|nr:hypothetical protein [Lichenibacterium sp. 6Y81]